VAADEEGPCSHFAALEGEVRPRARGCEECLAQGDRWIHLRMCLSCGHVGCCDSSKNKHATKHFHSTKHPLVRSAEPGESWVWCYVDELGFEPT
jgi:monovalent cation:H+ antiporter-2, CPA2 family